jgi:hypothetical protein
MLNKYIITIIIILTTILCFLIYWLFIRNKNTDLELLNTTINPIIPDNKNIFIFTENDKTSYILDVLKRISDIQGGKNSVWGKESFLLLFQPGTYDFKGAVFSVHFYTSIRGLGTHPSETVFNNCTVTIQDINPKDKTNTTELFWRDMENIQVNGDIQWYVSQACPIRRIICNGHISVNNNVQGSWASGGWASNIETNQNITAGLQQQFCYKNITAPYITPSGMNTTILNSETPNNSHCSDGQANTVTVVNDINGYSKPWIVSDGIIIPYAASKENGSDLSPSYNKITNIHIVKDTDTVEFINSIIASTEALVFTSGNYTYNSTINIPKDNYVVFGLGWPIINAGTNTSPIFNITGSNVWISSLLLDAGTGNPEALLKLSSPGKGAKMHDIFTRILTPKSGTKNSCASMIVIDQDNTYVENIWLWVADHQHDGNTTNWKAMDNPNGLTVNGDNVVICGLAVEHQSDVMTLWNGEGGQCYFYQSEYPYSNHITGKAFTGKASYIVASHVTKHTFKGGGAYFVVWNGNDNPSIDHVMEFPDNEGVKWDSVIGANWGGLNAIKNILKVGDKTYQPVPGNKYFNQYAYCSQKTSNCAKTGEDVWDTKFKNTPVDCCSPGDIRKNIGGDIRCENKLT